MGFKGNLTLSFILHAALLLAAVTVIAGRDSAKRVPFTMIHVDLTTEPSSPIKHISSIREMVPFPKTAATSPRPIAQIPSSQHIETIVAPAPRDGTKKDENIALVGKTGDKDSVRSQGFNFIDNGLISGSPAITSTSIAGHIETQSFVRSGPVTVEGKGHANVLASIRTALERAKYYPLTAKRRGIEGTAIVEFTISHDGMPNKINIATSSGSDILDNAALATVTKAAPFPHEIRSIKVPISFKLEKD